jgi:predicted ArsR family transcriptional regulator
LVKEITTTTPARRKMYRLFNGRLRIEEVAKKVGTSAEAVRLFAEECRRAGLVEYLAPKKGRGRFPKRVV